MSVYLNSSSNSGKNVSGRHIRIVCKLKRSLKVIEHLGGEVV
jgi:hypothetical protein